MYFINLASFDIRAETLKRIRAKEFCNEFLKMYNSDKDYTNILQELGLEIEMDSRDNCDKIKATIDCFDML